MSWLNDSLNSLKGQITNFATEVLAEGIVEDSNETYTGLEAANAKLQQLDERCRTQDEEIAALKRLNDELQKSLQAERLSSKNGAVGSEEEATWFWDPPADARPGVGGGGGGRGRGGGGGEGGAAADALHDEISELKRRLEERDRRSDNSDELDRLREENANLTANLEDLDHQHQLAMERLLTLKKDLQRNFEILKQEHEELKASNEHYAREVRELKGRLEEGEGAADKWISSKTEYETLHHKYDNLEKVHRLLQETTEKFQEENQELHEEIFKLQEELAKHDHVEEVMPLAVTDMIPREKYEALLKELLLLQEHRRSTDSVHLDDSNIDDNAKSVIENLKRDISDLKQKLAHRGESDNNGGGVSNSGASIIEADALLQMYKKYIHFDLPVDVVDELPSTGKSNSVYKIEMALKSVNTFKKEIDVLEHKLSEKAKNESHLRSQIDDLTSDNEFLTADLQQCEQELSEMKKNNDFLLSEITVLKNASKLEPIIESHEDNIVKLESELADCNKINKGFEQEIISIEKQLSEVGNEKKLLQTDLRDLREKYNNMLLELDTYKSKSAAVHQIEMDKQVEHSEKLRKALEEIDDLKRKLTLTSSKNEQLNIDKSIIENEKVLLTRQLDEVKNNLEEKIKTHGDLAAMKIVLEQNVLDLQKKIEELQKENQEILKQKNEILTNKTAKDVDEDDFLRRIKMAQDKSENYISEVESTIAQHKETEIKLRAEIEELKKSDNFKVNEKVIELSKENNDLSEKIKSCHIEIEDYKIQNQELKLEIVNHKNHSVAGPEIQHLENEVAALKTNLEDHAYCMSEIEGLRQDKHHLLEVKTQFERDLAIAEERMVSVDNKLEQLSVELKAKDDEIDSLNAKMHENALSTTTLKEAIVRLNDTIGIKDEEILLLNNTIKDLSEKYIHMECATTTPNNNHEIAARKKMSLQKEIEELKTNVIAKEKTIIDSKSELERLNKTVVDNKSLIDNLTTEKAELVAYVTVKHNENIQYHNEIQRLNQVILHKSEENKETLELCSALQKKAEENNTECEKLKAVLHQRDEKLMKLNEQSNSSESDHTELLHAKELIKNLTDKCEELDKNLTIQLDVVKRLTTEKAQVSEREQTLGREVERLRRHLAETEQTHTQELLASEQKVNECQSKLLSIEERAKQTGTVYTSNSIRANQELETLRNQIRLLERQREEAQARLSEAADTKRRGDDALDKLQAVLRQFQADKERDIATATSKLRARLEEAARASEGLRAELRARDDKLEEALRGLQAAARLGDQLESKAAQLAEYRERVRTLQEAAAAAEARYQAASRQQEKVDKGLVKNLLLNYLHAAAQRSADRVQVLRILSTVLDFNQTECERAGLGGARDAPHADSLAREFVRFLEKESRPTAAPPSMLGLARAPPPASTSTSPSPAPPSSRRSSGLGPQPTPHELYGHRRDASTGSANLLLHDLAASSASPSSVTPAPTVPAPTAAPADHTGVAQTRNTEGAILKHVLKDL